MPDTARRPISILIAALGGQGGGVLTDWIVRATTEGGYPAQSTSIPGVAQRTGATTYYVECYPVAERPNSAPPVLSLYPAVGDVDVIVAPELLEAGRMLEMDYGSPERTTLVASTHRLYAIGEKTVGGDGIFPRERIEEAARQLTRRLVAFDALAVARTAGSEVNAVMLGALAAAGVLPLPDSAFEAAIRESGIAVERNLAGFKAGRETATSGAARTDDAPARRNWAEAKAERAAALGRRGAAFLAVTGRMERAFPEPLHRTLGEAIARLVDYQDARYAEDFLVRLARVRTVDPGPRLTEAFARRLAVWMTYEDAIRVADLKTRRSRFERIRRENAVPAGARLAVTDYLKPDLDELYGILPTAVGEPIARWAERRWPEERPTIPQHVRTTSISGFLRVWTLGRLRWLRRRSIRFRREAALMARWERAVLAAARLDGDLALEVAELAMVVRGYGAVRRRLAAGFARLLDEVVTPALEGNGTGAALAARRIRDARRLMLEDERGVGAALAMATAGAAGVLV